MRFRRVPVILVVGIVAWFTWESRVWGDPPRVDTSRDVQQTIQARLRLLDEPELADMNIGVMVQSRVVILWGPVPSAEVAFRAELCLRGMFDIVEIRNELFVREQLEPVPVPPQRDNKPVILPPPPPLPKPKEQRASTGAPGVLMGHEVRESEKKSLVELTPLLPMSIRVGQPQPEKAYPTPVSSGEMTDADRKTAAAVRTLLNGDAKYRELKFAVQEGRVYLKADNPESDVLLEAAREISRLPNLAGVVVMDNKQPR